MHCNRIRESGASVIIPTFNRASYLYSTLLLLCNQQTVSDIPYEIIIIDSGSDNSGTVVNYFTALHPGIITYQRIKKCRNRSQLRNTGAAAAKYDVLIFLDNDILVPPDFIKVHFEAHCAKEHLVLLGRRRSLTSFSIEDTGKEMLCTDFRLLETLPWFEDERMFSMSGTHLWRFAYSHGMSLHAEDFFSAGQFNVRFGEFWGFEDIELGFNLMNAGCSFEFLREPCSYHQPHFDQSISEQRRTLPNSQLFIRLHNCFAVELCIGFYSRFNELYPLLDTIPFTAPVKTRFRKFPLVLGCLFRADNPNPADTMFLGLCIPKKNGSCRNVLILETFFLLPPDIQRAVITEAFRVSSLVTVEAYNEDHVRTLTAVCASAGFSAGVRNADGMIETTILKRTAPAVYSFVLPDILSPEKRYVFLWLAGILTSRGCTVALLDVKNAGNAAGTDFALPDETAAALLPLINRSYGSVRMLSVFSAAALQSEKLVAAPDCQDTYVMHDEDFLRKYPSADNNGYAGSTHSEPGCYQFLSFSCVYDVCRSYSQSANGRQPDETFCCCMENGFLEDGIDILLKAFGTYAAAHPAARLSVKIPDHEQLLPFCYPLHNEASKNAKMFGIRQKINSDIHRFISAVTENGLTDNVDIIRRNMNISELIAFIAGHSCLVHVSRGICTPPQVYAAVLLQKKTIIAQHHRMLHLFPEYCISVPSELRPFSEELAVPLICANAVYSAGRTDEKSLCSAFAAPQPKRLTAKEASDTAELFDPLFFFHETV